MAGVLLVIAGTQREAQFHAREWRSIPEVRVVGPTEFRKVEGLRLRDAILTQDAEHVLPTLHSMIDVAVRSLILSGTYGESVLLQQLERLGVA